MAQQGHAPRPFSSASSAADEGPLLRHAARQCPCGRSRHKGRSRPVPVVRPRGHVSQGIDRRVWVDSTAHVSRQQSTDTDTDTSHAETERRR
eukprot:1940311-Rhodomonas_salina.1